MKRTDLMTWQAENVVGVRYVETLVYCAKQCYGWVDFGIAFFPPFLFFLLIFFSLFFLSSIPGLLPRCGYWTGFIHAFSSERCCRKRYDLQ